MSFDVTRMLKFEHNLSEKEKKYRMIGGAALIVISVVPASIPMILVGMIAVATGYSGWCPVCSGINRNTCDSGVKSSEVSDSKDSGNTETG
jgi:hypothetical protein